MAINFKVLYGGQYVKVVRPYGKGLLIYWIPPSGLGPDISFADCSYLKFGADRNT